MDDIYELLEVEKILKFAEDLEDAALLLKLGASSKKLTKLLEKIKNLPTDNHRLFLKEFFSLTGPIDVRTGLPRTFAPMLPSSKRVEKIMEALRAQIKDKRRSVSTGLPGTFAPMLPSSKRVEKIMEALRAQIKDKRR